MTTHTPGYRELIKESYGLTKKHLWFLIGLLAIHVIFGILTDGADILGSLISMALSIATTYALLSMVDGHTPTYKSLLTPFKTYKVAWHYFLASLIIFAFAMGFAFLVGLSLFSNNGVVVGVMTALFLLACVYFGVRLGFFYYFIVEHASVGPIASFKKSFELTKGRFWYILGLWFALLLLNLLGLLALVVGLLVTIPITLVAVTLLYRKWVPKHVHTETHHHEA